jgi:hypothetical protein
LPDDRKLKGPKPDANYWASVHVVFTEVTALPRRNVKSIVDGPGPAEPAILNESELIARRAYELYESRGSGPGDELTDWLTAEREVLAGATSLKQEAPCDIDNPKVVAAPEPRKKTSKVTPTVASRRKASSTTTRSSDKPKGAHP